MKTTGALLLDLLEQYGIDTIFGIPGVHTVELYRHLPSTGLTHITPRHEQGAGFMADGFARATGRPAACFIISGPGMTNIMTAMAQAYSDSVPMLVISSVNNSFELALGQGRLHELPSQRQVTQGACVFSHTLARAEELPEVMARAFSVFDSARPGPVHIEIPIDVITEAFKAAKAPARKRYRPGPDREGIGDAADLIASAENPVVVLGGGTQDAGEDARRLVDMIGAPTILTINAKGVLPGDHPLSLGSRLPQRPVLDALESADVVLAIGTELGETDTLLFNDQLNLQGKLIRIDIEAEQLTRNALPAVAICSDAGLAMAALADELQRRQFDRSDDRAQSLLNAANQTIPDVYQMHGRFLQCVADTLPGVVIVGDSTQPVYGGNLTYNGDAPRSYFNSSTGYGTLGYALSAALGAKLGCPDRPVVALIGDGGMQFTISELATAVELALPVPILLWNNDGYGEIKRYMEDRDIPTIGVDIYTPDFLKIAEGFGCHSVMPGSKAAFVDTLKEANRASLPTVIELKEEMVSGWFQT